MVRTSPEHPRKGPTGQGWVVNPHPTPPPKREVVVLQEQTHAVLIRPRLVENERNGERGRRQASPLHPNRAAVLKDAF